MHTFGSVDMPRRSSLSASITAAWTSASTDRRTAARCSTPRCTETRLRAPACAWALGRFRVGFWEPGLAMVATAHGGVKAAGLAMAATVHVGVKSAGLAMAATVHVGVKAAGLAMAAKVHVG
eukprot:354712-Chlamydomonas_euryale.AAC.1